MIVLLIKSLDFVTSEFMECVFVFFSWKVYCSESLDFVLLKIKTDVIGKSG